MFVQEDIRKIGKSVFTSCSQTNNNNNDNYCRICLDMFVCYAYAILIYEPRVLIIQTPQLGPSVLTGWYYCPKDVPITLSGLIYLNSGLSVSEC